MSNTANAELNHITKTTLTVDCGDHCECIAINGYPNKYDESACGAQRLGIPAPTAIEFECEGECAERHNLYTDREIYDRVQTLFTRVQTVLQASVVNEKQRAALTEIVRDYFDETTASFYGPRPKCC